MAKCIRLLANDGRVARCFWGDESDECIDAARKSSLVLFQHYSEVSSVEDLTEVSCVGMLIQVAWSCQWPNDYLARIRKHIDSKTLLGGS